MSFGGLLKDFGLATAGLLGPVSQLVATCSLPGRAQRWLKVIWRRRWQQVGLWVLEMGLVQGVQISLFGVIPKSQPGKWRLIVDLFITTGKECQ